MLCRIYYLNAETLNVVLMPERATCEMAREVMGLSLVTMYVISDNHVCAIQTCAAAVAQNAFPWLFQPVQEVVGVALLNAQI